jgi:hypothetical protein
MNEQADTAKGLTRCEDIQPLLFDYLARELGAGRADLVRAHLKRCDACQAEAAGIQATMELLQATDAQGGVRADRLSEQRRARLRWAFMHPVLDWVHAHHVVFSVIAAALVIVLLALLLRRVQAWRQERPEPGPVVTIGTPDPPPP